ncbi:LysE/ArgO family amino acid transporter [Paenibacillus apiarius]|uniref:LysE/ArgO family amino acid transporter n=1 Tax=Paenibacillus apiarius TaxID=46240 RepID=A0ABT4E1P8_9BACL|nr:LysE/ArgO family amino acid transporter [Paenibacillus apiarius]MCY9515001.1 LysE/ArgO family amino acid transporter [Paenibacillus apiarius]MCY9522438.1 LysE/ArgO family amino acid transporter [Paenibacillus apiarius]MCY9552142.1 LysE/ArgO family amino acid transporter [Paenibacillus apiarius]MCY9561071.1 LysE/ArgO family amino acid transporter [Paenibacillus apiarius]MCY9686288.1 LysE/ArgO family amino acid transporter [Paenibacillus apiarius]
MAEAFVHGVLLAFGLILPLGVQNVFIFNQGAIQPRFIRVIPVIITAALCDTMLISLAVGGVSLLILQWMWLKSLLYVAGFFFLLYMGWSLWKAEVSTDHSEHGQLSIKRQVLFALSVSMLNPHALMDTIGVIGTNSLQYIGTDKWAFIGATIGISWLWFFGLAIAGRILRTLDNSGRLMRGLNKISALTIWLIAVYMGMSMITSL